VIVANLITDFAYSLLDPRINREPAVTQRNKVNSPLTLDSG